MTITIKDVAEKAGVSFSTVSKALRNSPLVQEKTRVKILQAANELGYQPNIAARRLVSKKSWTVGVVWPSVERVTLSTLITKINDELEKRSYTTLLSINRLESALDTFNRLQVDAILVFYDRDQSHLQHIPLSTHIPILYYGITGETPYSTIEVNRKKAIKLAVDHLIDLGHKELAYIGRLNYKDPLQMDKCAAFEEEMRRHSLPATIIPISGMESNDGYLAARNILAAKYKPTGIISGSYDLTRGILRACAELKFLLPEQLSIVSYDNIPQMENLDIPMTSVGVNIQTIAEEITHTLLKMVDPQDIEQKTVNLQPDIVIRASTAKNQR
jgi:LacI family transcriptional regulator